jgi:hypothetical protein
VVEHQSGQAGCIFMFKAERGNDLLKAMVDQRAFRSFLIAINVFWDSNDRDETALLS